MDDSYVCPVRGWLAVLAWRGKSSSHSHEGVERADGALATISESLSTRTRPAHTRVRLLPYSSGSRRPEAARVGLRTTKPPAGQELKTPLPEKFSWDTALHQMVPSRGLVVQS